MISYYDGNYSVDYVDYVNKLNDNGLLNEHFSIRGVLYRVAVNAPLVLCRKNIEMEKRSMHIA